MLGTWAPSNSNPIRLLVVGSCLIHRPMPRITPPTSCSNKVQKFSSEAFLVFIIQEKKRTNIQNRSIFPKNMFWFFFKLKIQTDLIIDPVIIEKQHFKPHVVTCLQIHFFSFLKKKEKREKTWGVGGVGKSYKYKYKSLRLYVSYYFIQSAHTRWMALKGQHVRCSKHTLSSRRNRYDTINNKTWTTLPN